MKLATNLWLSIFAIGVTATLTPGAGIRAADRRSGAAATAASTMRAAFW